MSTWHQQRNPVPLWHESLWTLVTNDAPGQHTCVERFATGQEAAAAHARQGGYILQPAPLGMPYATFRFNGETVHMNKRQFDQALADSKLCRCNACLVCRAAEYHRETTGAKA